jgi:effector-binding domain-containing protein
MLSRFCAFAVTSILIMVAAVWLSTTCGAAETSPTSPATPAAAQAPTTPPQSPAGQEPSTGRTPPAAPSENPRSAPEASPDDASTGQTVELPARPFAYIEGKADRDQIYGAILASLGVVKQDMDKAGIKPAGRPLAVFIDSDDTGFRYHAGYPFEGSTDGKTSLSDAVKIGQTPSGKAMRFEHLGSYDDIDATYDAITAYLDEKGIEAQDSFVEEYAKDVKDPADPTLQVNIYVLLK